MPRTAASGGRRRPARAHASATTWRFRSSWCLYVACWSWQPRPAPRPSLRGPGRWAGGSAAPQGDGVLRGLEPRGLDHLGRYLEALGDLVRAVGVAAVLDRLAADLAPPAHDREVRAEHGAARGVHLQHASRASRRLEDVANGLLEVPFVVGRGAGRPVALGVVEVSK